MTVLALRVEAPIVSFRNPYAREFAETFRVPPPSTVYGMLLSMVGEERRARHAGVRLAIATFTEPEVSVVLRTVWRVKDLSTGPGVGENRRMDFQQLLTGVHFAVWVDSSGEAAPGPPLAERLAVALRAPEEITRFGALSLGESRDLVDAVTTLEAGAPREGVWLIPEPGGNLSLPVWPDHVAGAGTRWASFRATKGPVGGDVPRGHFVEIAPPA
ncbi:MAG: type I-MYXAN CRISPR-associated protein Cas5/Cmx5/DevS [Polyangiales bacterium]